MLYYFLNPVMSKQSLSTQEISELIETLKTRFENNLKRHKGIEWTQVEEKLKANSQKLWSLNQMEITGGEPDVVGFNKNTKEYIFFDCSKESPVGRRSFCYDLQAHQSRKEAKPKNSAVGMANEIGIQLLTEEEYRHLQTLGEFDLKTSSWVKTPEDIRSLGGALFCDRRYNTVFVYHNGAESYYASRGFRGVIVI